MIRHLKLLVIYSIINIIKDLPQCFTDFLTKSLKMLQLIQEQELFLRISNWLMNFASLPLANLRKAKYTYLINIKFGELIFQTCNQLANTIRESYFYNDLLIFTANMDGLFRWKTASITIANAFQNILDECTRKPNTILVDQGSKFYNRSMR